MIPFILGESKTLDFVITNDAEEIFTIRSATFVITKDETIVERGNLTVTDHNLSMAFTPSEPGTYKLSIEYVIGPTVKKAYFYIGVRA